MVFIYRRIQLSRLASLLCCCPSFAAEQEFVYAKRPSFIAIGEDETGICTELCNLDLSSEEEKSTNDICTELCNLDLSSEEEKLTNDISVKVPESESEKKWLTLNDLEEKRFKGKGYFLGNGNFGAVFKVNTKNSEEVAIKIISKKPRDEKPFFEKLLRNELKMGKLLSGKHPNFLDLKGWDEEHAALILIMPLLQGYELFDFVNCRFEFSDEQMNYIFKVILDALRWLHKEKKIVHRDIKIENIMIDCNGAIKILDFAFCKQCGKDEDIENFCKTWVGTLPSMAPEFFSRSCCYGFPVDMWALGIIMCELSGIVVFPQPQNPRMYYKEILCLMLDWKTKSKIKSIVDTDFFKNKNIENQLNKNLIEIVGRLLILDSRERSIKSSELSEFEYFKKEFKENPLKGLKPVKNPNSRMHKEWPKYPRPSKPYCVTGKLRQTGIFEEKPETF